MYGYRQSARMPMTPLNVVGNLTNVNNDIQLGRNFLLNY